MTKIKIGSITSDQWIARGMSVVGLFGAAFASGLQFQHPIAATLLLTIVSLLFIFALWLAARNRVRWLDSAVILLCLTSLALCSYRVTQQLKNVHRASASTADSTDPNVQSEAQ